MNEKNDKIPAGVAGVLEKLTAAGQEAYLVGGCVRDRYRAQPPHDYDIATSALPEETLRIFRQERVLETGLQHGTVTVLTADGPVEVTTYRQDGAYSDHRHPDGVTFTRSLREDLARRDFTMNAMAMNIHGSIVDPFGGRADLHAGLIRCVGNADLRFEEDALRILRGLRFAARLGFALEPETAAAMGRKKELLKEIARERVFAELCGLLEGDYAAEVLRAHWAVAAVVLPEAKENFDVLAALPPRPALRMAALLSPAGEEAAGKALSRLKAPNAFRREVRMLLAEHERLCLPERKSVRRRCMELGIDDFLTLLMFQRGEEQGKTADARKGEAYFDALTALAEQLIREHACLRIRDLAVDGTDLMALGYQGPAVGQALQALLEQVTEETLPNERQALLEYLKK